MQREADRARDLSGWMSGPPELQQSQRDGRELHCCPEHPQLYEAKKKDRRH